MHIKEFQEMMKHLFYHRDSERGVKGTYDWLVDEPPRKSLQTSSRGLHP